MDKFIEVILSNDSILLEEVQKINLQTSKKIEVYNISNKQEWDNHKTKIRKINLLIIDDINDIPDEIKDRANYIISLNKPLPGAIILVKPFKINALFKIMDDIFTESQRSLFCCINNHAIFNEKSQHIIFDGKIVQLTERENFILASLLKAEGFSLSKDHIIQELFGYAGETETNSLETNLYRLKQKIADHFPKNFILNENNYLKLTISDLQ